MATRNASLLTWGQDGGSVQTDLWIVAFSPPDLDLQMTSAQLQTAMSWQPIRKQEQKLTFDVVYSARNWQPMDSFADRLFNHYKYALNATSPNPMVLTYYALNKTYQGWIEQTDKGDTKFQSLYRRSYSMRIVNPSTLGSMIQVSAPYLPTSTDATWDSGWYQLTYTNDLATQELGNGPVAPDHLIPTIQ